MSIEEKIIQLELEAINGQIPTWYAYQEIDRLNALRDSRQSNFKHSTEHDNDKLILGHTCARKKD